MMETVRVELSDRSYDIVIGRGTLPCIGERIRQFNFNLRIAVISNPTVFGLYGAQVMTSLGDAGFSPFPVLIPDGEEYKDYFWTYHLITELMKKRLDRNSCLIALGGGVIGDITGFAASIYMRGIPFVQIPTTLLAQVDSSVGGKTGVNHLLGKNMIGTFYQPRLVWIDSETLLSLPVRELTCGVAEVIKYGIIWDSDLFRLLNEGREAILRRDAEAVRLVVKRSCEIKAEVVSKDERESGLRAILNYGHTVGHAIETETGYLRFLHGEAIAIGMSAEARIATLLGYLGREDLSAIESLIEAYHLPCELPGDLDIERLLSHMYLDKKAVAGQMTFVLPRRVGEVIIQKGIAPDDVRRALAR